MKGKVVCVCVYLMVSCVHILTFSHFYHREYQEYQEYQEYMLALLTHSLKHTHTLSFLLSHSLTITLSHSLSLSTEWQDMLFQYLDHLCQFYTAIMDTLQHYNNFSLTDVLLAKQASTSKSHQRKVMANSRK